MANVFDPRFDDETTDPGFSHRRARLGRQAGAQRLGASVYEIPPGEATFPYHAHSANEEMLVVLSGRPSLRTPDGWRELDEGEVVFFPVGPDGAHQVMNRSSNPARVLMISEMNAPEVTLYPDSDKVGAATRPPGGAGEGFFGFFRLADAVERLEGEGPPSRE